MADETPQVPKSADDMLADLNRYFNNEPLNEELAAVQRGEVRFVDAPEPDVAVAKVELGDVERELTRQERIDLRELRQSDGYRVLLRIQEKRFQNLHKRAITISQNHPLANQQAVIHEWVEANAYRNATREMWALVDAELKILWDQENK